MNELVAVVLFDLPRKGTLLYKPFPNLIGGIAYHTGCIRDLNGDVTLGPACWGLRKVKMGLKRTALSTYEATSDLYTAKKA